MNELNKDISGKREQDGLAPFSYGLAASRNTLTIKYTIRYHGFVSEPQLARSEISYSY